MLVTGSAEEKTGIDGKRKKKKGRTEKERRRAKEERVWKKA